MAITETGMTYSIQPIDNRIVASAEFIAKLKAAGWTDTMIYEVYKPIEDTTQFSADIQKAIGGASFSPVGTFHPASQSTNNYLWLALGVGALALLK